MIVCCASAGIMDASRFIGLAFLTLSLVLLSNQMPTASNDTDPSPNGFKCPLMDFPNTVNGTLIHNVTRTAECLNGRDMTGCCVERFYCVFNTSNIDLSLYGPPGYHILLWLVLTLSAFGGAVYCALSQYFRYNSEPVVVSLQRDYRSWWTTFPAVTACFLDRVQPDKARELVEDTWNVTEESDPVKYSYYYEFIELIADVSFRENLQNFWKYQADDTVKGIDLLELALTVHPSSVLQMVVSNNEHEVHWNPVMTEVGMCLTFNSVYAEFQHMLQEVDWTPFQLLECHYHSGQCSVRIDSMNNAVRYFIHSPYEISTAISNPTGEVLPGEELIIDYKVIEIQASPSVKSLRSEQRRCKYPDEWISDSIRAYSFSLCQMHCRSRMAVMFCGCRPYFHVKGASLGGTTALFVGASVLTVVETVLFIVRHLVRLIIRRGRGRVVDFKP